MYSPSPSVERAPTRGWLLRETLAELDRELVVLAQGTAALRLGVGDALVELGAQGGPLGLGFSSLEAYAKERCEHSGRWARDSRALARRLRERPAMRAALLAGELSWSMAELLSRHGDASHEQQLLDQAQGKTVRQMREHFRQQAEEDGSPSAPGDSVDEPEPLVTLTVTMTTEEAWAFECTKMLVQAMGAQRDTDVIDSLLAEGMTTSAYRACGRRYASLLGTARIADVRSSAGARPSRRTRKDRLSTRQKAGRRSRQTSTRRGRASAPAR